MRVVILQKHGGQRWIALPIEIFKFNNGDTRTVAVNTCKLKSVIPGKCHFYHSCTVKLFAPFFEDKFFCRKKKKCSEWESNRMVEFIKLWF